MKEIGKPMKMAPSIPTSMTRPRNSSPGHTSIFSLCSSSRPSGRYQALHQLGDALDQKAAPRRGIMARNGQMHRLPDLLRCSQLIDSE